MIIEITKPEQELLTMILSERLFEMEEKVYEYQETNQIIKKLIISDLMKQTRAVTTKIVEAK